MSAASWVRPIGGPASAAAAGSVVCFPHAGGSPEFFRSWSVPLGTDVALHAVRYPGWQPPPDAAVGSIVELAAAVAEELAVRPPVGPLLLFGHSMGAVVAFETARILERWGVPSTLSLVVSGSVPPWERAPSAVHREDDNGLVTELRRLGGTDDALVADPEQRAVWLPAIRADFRLVETHRHRPAKPLACPVTAVLGNRDTEASVAGARGWREVTQGRFRLRTLPGGHFYLRDKRDPLIAQLRRWLLPAATESSTHLPVPTDAMP